MKSKQEEKLENETGIVLRATKNVFIVLPIHIFQKHLKKSGFSENELLKQSIECRLKGKRGFVDDTDLNYSNYLIAGDFVEYKVTDSNKGSILKRLPRKSSIARVQRKKQQLLAVNIDLLVSVFSIKDPSFQANFFDKILCLAILENLPLLVVLNKIDLYSNSHKKINSTSFPSPLQSRIEILQRYMSETVKILYTSTQSMLGIDDLEQSLQNTSSAIIGQSGVGKSSILNVLNTKLQRKTADISYKYDFGKHTTSMPELCICKNYAIVDNPGVRDLIPVGLSAQNSLLAFPEFTDALVRCKLPHCSHRIEPRCSVRDKVGKQISKERYDEYLKLRIELEYIEKKQCYPRN